MNAIAEPLEFLDLGHDRRPPPEAPGALDAAPHDDDDAPPRDPACGERVLAWTVARICACPDCAAPMH